MLDLELEIDLLPEPKYHVPASMLRIHLIRCSAVGMYGVFSQYICRPYNEPLNQRTTVLDFSSKAFFKVVPQRTELSLPTSNGPLDLAVRLGLAHGRLHQRCFSSPSYRNGTLETQYSWFLIRLERDRGASIAALLKLANHPAHNILVSTFLLNRQCPQTKFSMVINDQYCAHVILFFISRHEAIIEGPSSPQM